MEWNTTTLQMSHLRRPVISQLLRDIRRITKATHARLQCAMRRKRKIYQSWNLKITDFQSEFPVFLKRISDFWRDGARLLTVGAAYSSQLFIPLAYEHLGTHLDDYQLHEWIKDMELVRDMLHRKLMGWARDMQSASEQAADYKMEEDPNRTGNYILRRPVLNDYLFAYQEAHVSLSNDFAALCEKRQPKAPEMFGLADILHSFYYVNWFDKLRIWGRDIETTLLDEQWQLEDRGNDTLSVDTGCMQVLANALDHPTCPLGDLQPETVEQRKQCRQQLWEDMVQRSPHIPVTSYLAYTQRTNVNLCLLAWMAANSLSICQDVPFSMLQSVHDARCYFEEPDDQSCLQSNSADAICAVSRAVLLLKCRDFSSLKPSEICVVRLYTDESYSKTLNTTWDEGAFKGFGKPTRITLNYKDTLNSATLKYKDFTVENLKLLEISFVITNIFFRILTAWPYMYIPQLRNLPGKFLLSFQLTGIIQILFSEVVYRMSGVLSLSTAVLIDTALTLLSCIWLNLFCHLMYACARHLRLPNDLLPTEASSIFCRQVIYALITWSVVCAACIGLENTSKYYVFHSRILFLVGISLSICYNLGCLGLVVYMYLRNKKSMNQLKIDNKDKLGSKKQLTFLSVKAVILSGIGILIRTGFHQAQGIAQFVYYVHIATMLQGPVLFVFFVCSGTTLPLLKKKVLLCWNPEMISSGQELCSSAERNRGRRTNLQPVDAETSL